MTQAEQRATDSSTIHIKMFGQLELQNQQGRITENLIRETFPWLLLKYLLTNMGRAVTLAELSSVLWPNKMKTDQNGNIRVRLYRLREALEPLGLGGQHGLVLSQGQSLSLNPEYTLATDTGRFLTLVNMERDTALDNHRGLELCREALELYRGPVFSYTSPAFWLMRYRYPYQEGFKHIVQQSLKRMALTGSEEFLHLLCRRAIQVMPEEHGLHDSIINYLLEHQKQAELVSHITQLALIQRGQSIQQHMAH